jgi:hypothetical protein
VTLNYTLGSAAASKIGMSSASFFVQGLNLATFTNFNGIDPEVVGITGDTTFGRYPNAKQFSAGLTLNF